MPNALPDPPLPATVDLRDFPGMMLHVARLRDSATVFKTRPEEFRSAVLLWCASWHQVPAASLPDDDAELAKYAGYGLAVKAWAKVREGALRGFMKCSDGRLYHGVVAEVAIAAWISKLKGRWEREKGRLKKEAQRAKKPVIYPEFNVWITRECPQALPYLSPGQHADVPGETPSNRSEGISIPASSSTLTGDSEARATSHGNPGSETRTANPEGIGRRPNREASIASEGKRKGLEPRVGESMEAYESRVRTTRA